MDFYSFNRGLYKRLHKYFSFRTTDFQLKKEIILRLKEKKCKPLSKSQKQEIKEYFTSFGFPGINTNWHRFNTAISGNYHKEYIPENLLYNIIEPNLNMLHMKALADKNLMGRLIEGVEQPKTIIKNINGLFYKGENFKIFLSLEEVLKECGYYQKLVIKPSIDSYGGKNVVIFELKNQVTDFNSMSMEELLIQFNENFIIQEAVQQHEKMAQLNFSSLNTLRVSSLLIDGNVEILNSTLRFGAPGSKVDNISSGGIMCPVDSHGFCGSAFSHNWDLIMDPKIVTLLKKFQIPNYPILLEDVKRLHIQMPYFKLVSWDIAVGVNGQTILVEYNIQGQGSFQSIGNSFFGKYTDRVLSSCKFKKFQFD